MKGHPLGVGIQATPLNPYTPTPSEGVSPLPHTPSTWVDTRTPMCVCVYGVVGIWDLDYSQAHTNPKSLTPNASKEAGR